MSLITACPACQTQFEVNDEQLQAYAGKVRCGECNHVFDARSSLVDAIEVTQSAPSENLQTSPREAGNGQPVISQAGISYAAVAVADTAENLTAVGGSELADVVTYTTETYSSDPAQVSAATLDSPTAQLDASLATNDDEPDDIDQYQPSWNLGEEASSQAAIPEFLRKVTVTDERPSPPAKTTVRWVFPLLSAVLVFALFLQVVYFTRTSLAANYPFTKPMLQAACKVAHCTVALPKDIAQLTIDDADIQEHREREGVLVFSSVLINHGAVPQAYPMIELTLTNMADEPVLRKILKPKDYLPATSHSEEGLAAQQEQAVKTLLGIEEKAVTGFRVAIAY